MGEQIIRFLKCNKCGSMLLLHVGDMHIEKIKDIDKKRCPVCKESAACFAHHVQDTTLEEIEKALTKKEFKDITPDFKEALFDLFSIKPRKGRA